MAKTVARPGLTRRGFVKRVGLATAIAAGASGTARKVFSYSPGTSITFLLWMNFSPPADVEIARQGAECGKQNNI